MISLSDPILGEEEKRALCSVIDSGWISMGEKVRQFESAFARLHGIKDAAAVNSCTAGLHLCLAAFGIGPGDEVLVPSLTFAATINAVLYVGANPVFVDIADDASPHISLADAGEKCTQKTRAVIIMHYGGYLMDLSAWRSFCDERGLILVEDAAHCAGLEGAGKGSDAAAFSFFTNKNMTTAEGGMVFARDEEILSRIRLMRGHGMSTGTLDRYRGHAYSYDITVLGYNYRLDELRAAMGLAQLDRLPGWNRKRVELTRHYRELLHGRNGLVVPFTVDHPSSAHLMPVLLPEGIRREAVMDSLRSEGIQSSIHYPPAHLFSFYRGRFPASNLLHTEYFCRRELSLPLHPALTECDVDRVAKALLSAL